MRQSVPFLLHQTCYREALPTFGPKVLGKTKTNLFGRQILRQVGILTHKHLPPPPRVPDKNNPCCCTSVGWGGGGTTAQYTVGTYYMVVGAAVLRIRKLNRTGSGTGPGSNTNQPRMEQFILRIWIRIYINNLYPVRIQFKE